MAYKEIEKKSFGTGSTVPSVTVTKDALYINKAARAAFSINDYKFLTLMADDEAENKLGIRLEETPSLNSQPIRVTDGSLNVGAKRTIKLLNIKPGRYELAASDDDDSVLEFTFEKQDEETEAGKDEEAAGEEEQEEKPVRRRGRPRKAA